MKVTYILHSGFALELEGASLLFDYYKGELPIFDKGKPLYVFASHRHHDHFNRDILGLRGQGYDLRFILSKDIRLKDDGEDIFRMGAGASLDLDGLKISTLKSTDEGVAFIVETGGRAVYHAGDLNLWVWKEESADYNAGMTKKYLKQIDSIAGRHFDVAFLPLDPRQEDDREKGLLAFLQRCDADHIFPMHMWDDYSVIPSLKKAHPGLAPIIAGITHPGQVFEI